MKPFFCFLFSLIITSSINAQNTIPNLDTMPDRFEDFLLQLAWQNTPSNRVLEFNQNIAAENTKIAKMGWTRAFGFNFGFNQNADENDPTMPVPDAILFPRVSIGASLNLNPLLTTSYQVRAAKETEKIAEAELYQGQVDIKETIYLLYEDYVLAKDVLKVRVKTEEDAKATFELIKELFKNSEVTFEDYNSAYTSYHQSVEAKLEAASKVRVAKINIEKWIGVSFDEAAKLFGIVQE
jgi:outer membrane protein TolC